MLYDIVTNHKPKNIALCHGCGKQFEPRSARHKYCCEACRWKKCIKDNGQAAQNARARSRAWYIATGESQIIPRRQELPKAFHRDGSIYLTKTEIAKAGSFYGKSIAYIESNADCYVNIDTMKDWEKAERLVTHFNS